jgi:hypothetical protein
MGNNISQEEMILIVICAAAVSVVLAYAVYRLMFSQPEAANAFHMSDEQLAYIRSVRDRNINEMMAKTGVSNRY